MAIDIRPLVAEGGDLDFTLQGLGGIGSSTGVGGRVETLGDFNGDGIDDVVVSAPGLDLPSPLAPRIDAGGAFVVYGGSALADAVSGGTLDLSATALRGLGFAVVGALSDDVTDAHAAGDVNGDGYADILLTAPSYVEVPIETPLDTGFDHRAGTATILYGGPDAAAAIAQAQGLLDLAAPVTEVTTIAGEATAERTGISVAAGGDINGDGLADIVLGTFQAAGIAYDPAGNAIELPVLPEIPDIPGLPGLPGLEIPDPGQGLGRLYVVYGDEAPDAEIDLATDVVGGDGSAGFLVRGYATTRATANGQEPDFFGGVGLFDTLEMADLTGDGRDELVIGTAFGGTLLEAPGGEAYATGGMFVLQVPDAIAPELDLRDATFLGGPRVGEFTLAGFNPVNLGDVNGDGIDDLAVSAPLLDVLRGARLDTNAGGIYGILGAADLLNRLDPSDGLAGAADFFLTGAKAGAAAPVALDDLLSSEDDREVLGSLGIGLAALGDVDGDGIDDFGVGLPEGGVGPGTVYVIRGRDGDSPLDGFEDLGNLGEDAAQSEAGVTELTAAEDDALGFAIARADLGDGPSLLLGAPGQLVGEDGFDRPGLVYVLDASALDEAEGGGNGGGGTPEPGRRVTGNGELVGGTGDDTIVGGAMDDTLRGLAGDDDLAGRGGDDVHAGGAGDDRYLIEDVGDVVVELTGEGMDQVFARVDVTLGAAEVEVVRLLGTDDLDVLGNGGAQQIVGNSGANILRGGGGLDTVTGGGGDDVFVLEFGNRADPILIADFGAGDRLAVDDRFFGGDPGIDPRPADARTVANALASGAAAYDRATGELRLGGELVAVLDGGPVIGGEDVLLF